MDAHEVVGIKFVGQLCDRFAKHLVPPIDMEATVVGVGLDPANVRLGLTGALERIKRHHPRLYALAQEDIRASGFALTDTQLVIARELSFESWPKLVKFITTI